MGSEMCIRDSTHSAVLQQFEIGGKSHTLDLPFGPYIRVSVQSAELKIADQTLTGNATIESVTDAEDGSSKALMMFTDVGLDLGDGLMTLSDGNGALIRNESGLAGKVSGSIGLQVEGLSLSGDLTVELNTIKNDQGKIEAVSESVRSGNKIIDLNVGAQSFAVTGEGVLIEAGGARIRTCLLYTSDAADE